MKKQSQLQNELKKLQYQLSYSEHINKELSAQLSTMCTKLGMAPSKYKQTTDIALISCTTHLQQLYYLQPLLMCYQETIHLLKSELEEAKQEAKVIQENVINIVQENGFFRNQLQAKIQMLTKAQNIGLTDNFLTLQNRDLRDKIGILNSKNQYLVRKNKEIEQQMDKIKRQSLSLYDKSSIQQLQYKSKQSQKQKETQILKLQTQLQVTKSKLENQRILVSQSEQKVSQLQTELLRYKNQIKLVRQQLESSQTLHTRSLENVQSENVTLKEQLSSSLKKEQEQFTKNMSIQSELQDKNNRIHNLSIQNAQLQSNNNNMLQMLEGYEVKVSGLNKKIKKMETQMKDMGDCRGQDSKRAEIAEWKLAEKNQEIERKQAEWRKQKARLTKMWEDRMETMKKSYQMPISNKQ